MIYALYNKDLEKKLTHPRLGVWYTDDYDEAQEMLADCHEYLEAIGGKDLISNFVIIDAETDAIIT
jgi:hypothetical protein